MEGNKMAIFDIFDLSGKVSIVTGGCHDLGKMIAAGLAEAGSNVVVCSRKVEKCEETAHELEKLGIKSLGIQCDITHADDIDSVVNETLKNFHKIDILVKNSGKTWSPPP